MSFLSILGKCAEVQREGSEITPHCYSVIDIENLPFSSTTGYPTLLRNFFRGMKSRVREFLLGYKIVIVASKLRVTCAVYYLLICHHRYYTIR